DVLFHPDGGRCLADRAVRALQDGAARHGAEVRFEIGSAQLAPDGDGVVVRAGGESWRASTAVVTAGAWVGKVLGAVGLAARLPPLSVTQEQVQHFTPRPALSAAAWPSFIHHRRPWAYGLHAAGEGVKVGFHMAGIEVDPDERVPRDSGRERAVVDYVQEWFPGVDATPVATTTCLYTSTPTEDFLIERIGPIVIGSPCSGHGFKFTPLIGRRLADLATA
ncbi:MAG: FAD-dependent oxidoreductase, partial [Acidimicrobiales bacterium]